MRRMVFFKTKQRHIGNVHIYRQNERKKVAPKKEMETPHNRFPYTGQYQNHPMDKNAPQQKFSGEKQHLPALLQ